MSDMNENFTKTPEIIKNHQVDIMKSSISKIKNTIEKKIMLYVEKTIH